MDELRVGIDIGGSSAKIGLVASSGEILVRGKVPTREAASAPDLVNHICSEVSGLLAHAGGRSLVGIGVGVPGYVTPEGLPEFTNVPLLNGYPIARRLSERFGVPAGIDNDANAAVLAEYRHGAGKGARRLMLVTGGTGIGVAVILDGALVKFTGGSTGSIGHLIVNPQSEDRCAAGCRGCLETLATAPALQRRAERAAVAHPESLLAERLARAGKVGVADVKAAADRADAVATSLLYETGWWFGVGLASFAAIFAPDRMLVGGGLSELGQPFHQGVLEGLHHVGMPYSIQGVPVIPASQGNDAGIIGAACLI